MLKKYRRSPNDSTGLAVDKATAEIDRKADLARALGLFPAPPNHGGHPQPFEVAAQQPQDEHIEHAGNDDGSIPDTLKKNGVHHRPPAAETRRPIDLEGPEQRYGRRRKHHIGQHVGKNQTETQGKPQAGDAFPQAPEMGGDIAGQQGKKEAVGRPPVKQISVPLKQQPQNDVHVRQIGQDGDKYEYSPTGMMLIGVLSRLVGRQTDGGVS